MADTSFGNRVWEQVKSTLKWIAAKLLGPLGAILVIALAILLVSLGYKELQIGGLLGKLLGRKDPETASKGIIEVANSIDPDRVKPDGTLLLPGEPDDKGQTQAIVVPIQDPGLFSNPDTVKFVPPGETKAVEVALPVGVKNKDVEQVVLVKPTVTAVTVKDSSKVTAQKIDDLLKKYGN